MQRDFRTAPAHGRVLRFLTISGGRGAADPGDAGARLCPADVFTVLWQALADVLGTAAAATLMRRAAKRALPRASELVELSITRESLEYRYLLPAAWREAAAGTPATPLALCELSRELCTLLVELTGPVVVNRLAQIPELHDLDILSQRAEGS